jgi:hypothetical protein
MIRTAINSMRSGNTIRLGCLFLVLALFGAQFHFCADLSAPNSGSHVCQVCATAGHAVISQVLFIDFSPAVSRFETASYQAEFAALSFKITSPRAPPSL